MVRPTLALIQSGTQAAASRVTTAPDGEPCEVTAKPGTLEYFPDHDGAGSTRYRYVDARGEPFIFRVPSYGCTSEVEDLMWQIIEAVDAEARRRERDAEGAGRRRADRLAARWMCDDRV
jgi:hypothetical protein